MPNVRERKAGGLTKWRLGKQRITQRVICSLPGAAELAFEKDVDMTFRWGLGPVFTYEWLTSSRRWQYYAGRSLFIACLLAALVVVWWSEAEQASVLTLSALARVGERYFYAIIGTQLTLVLLVAPAVTVGAICVDKARGTLLHLLVTDLSNAEIILGKLANRLGTLFGLVCCALPVLFLGTLMGGIDPEALLGAFLVTLGVALVAGTMGLALSVWCTRIYEGLLAAYLISTLVLLANPVWRLCLTVPRPFWLMYLDPFTLAFTPYLYPGTASLRDDVDFVIGGAAAAAVLAAVAVWRVRVVAIRQTSRPQRGPRLRWLSRLSDVLHRLPGPTLDRNPVLWREWRRKRPSRWVAAVWLVYALVAAAFTFYVIRESLDRTYFAGLGAFVNAFQVSVGLLLVSVSAVTTLTEERTRGTLDALLTTPLPARAIVWGKWWGVYRTVLLLVILPGAIGLALSTREEDWIGLAALVGLILAYGAAVTSLGLALATWLARPSRAVALNVVIYVLVAAGWVLMLLSLGRTGGDLGRDLAIGSPWFGPGQITADLRSPRHTEHVGAAFGWIVAYTILASVLLGLILTTFDACAGRSSVLSRPLGVPRQRPPG
jgi:ABC-type transport system involved in multi-copper enzyme maturation permease subunit